MPFGAIVSQEKCLKMLKGSLAAGRTAHAYLFEGIDGCGKEMAAMALIEAIFCGRTEGCGTCSACRKLARRQHPDLHILEPEGELIKIEQVRQLQKELSLRPFEAPRKACIIRRAEALNASSGNALLKTLEEPPGNALIILLTGRASAMLPTIVSRCQRVAFSPLPQEVVESLLLNHDCPPDRTRLAAALSEGSMEKALEIGLGEPVEERAELIGKMESLSTRNIATLFAAAEEMSREKEGIPDLLDMLITYMRDIILFQNGNDQIVNRDLLPLIEQSARRHPQERVMERIRRVLEARVALQRNVNPRLVLEILFMRLSSLN